MDPYEASGGSAANDVEIVPASCTAAEHVPVPRFNDAAIADRQLSFPWSRYQGPHKRGMGKKANVHKWECTICKMIGLAMKDRTDFQRHAASKVQKTAESTALQRSRMRAAQENQVVKSVAADLDMGGQLLIIASFMIGNGLSLVLFPQVLFQQSSNLRAALTDVIQ